MAVKRFYATQDNTITNAYKQNLTSRATGSNMGASDLLEVFSIYGQASTSSGELTRTLIQFDKKEWNRYWKHVGARCMSFCSSSVENLFLFEYFFKFYRNYLSNI